MHDKVAYTSDYQAEYSSGLDACSSLDDLKAFAEKWKSLASDTWSKVQTMRPEDWPAFEAGLKSERAGNWSGQAWTDHYADILLPETMFKVSIVANQFKVPWGTAYLQLKAAGRIKPDNSKGFEAVECDLG